MRRFTVARGIAVALGAISAVAGGGFLGCSSGEPITIGGVDAGESDAGADVEQLDCVIDGVASATEQCDDGNQIIGDGCENDCTFTCNNAKGNDDAKCDDGDQCNGAETCSDKHTCEAGKPEADGTKCGSGKVCKAGVCSAETCGDAFVTAPEECDDGNVNPDDGCDSCLFTCLSNDPTRDCSGGDVCAGTSKCDDVTHICSPGVPLPDGTSCAVTSYCMSGACTATVCGNMLVEQGEICDDGNPLDGDGCDADCTYSCVDPAVDCAAAPVCQKQTCTAQNVCASVADALQEDQPCAPNLVCKSGACIGPAAVCGNGTLEPGEQCDFGNQNGPGTGCEATCVFSCTMLPDSCPDADSCNGVETCTAVMVNGAAGQQCAAGTSQADCTACTGGLCVGAACKVTQCGDGCLDPGMGEQCEPPGSASCDATCQTIAICTNGVREGTEECDDGNSTNLDGCDSTCKFEQNQRATWLNMQYNVDAYCTANRLGSAIVTGTAQSQLQTSIDTGVNNGSTTIIFKAVGLDDLTGTADMSLQLGALTGLPETMMGGPVYNGASDLDWWHLINATSINMNRDPLNLLPASINAKLLTAGPGTMDVPVLIGPKTADMHLSDVKLMVQVNGTSTPTASAGSPPGHLASENLDPALVSFTSCGQPNANGSGKLCGNVSANSLSQIPIPTALTTGFTKCSQNYIATNSLLDVIVNGCTVFIQQIKPTQPDTTDLALPQPGGGAPYTLAVNAQKVVSTCLDKNNAPVNLAACLNAASYSAFFKFATGRVISK